MKRSIYILLIILIQFSFSGCHINDSSKVIDSTLFKTLDSEELNLSDSMYLSIESQIGFSPSYCSHKIDSILGTLSNNDNMYYEFILLKAKAMFFLSEIDSSFYYLDIVEKYCNEEPSSSIYNDLLLSKVYNMYGNIFSRNAILDSAVLYFTNAFNRSHNVGLSNNLINITLNLADSYVRSGRYDLGAYWYRYSLSVSDTLGISDKERFPGYYGLAQVYMELRDYEQCDYFYNLAGKYYDGMQPYEKHIYLNNRGNSYYFRGDYKTALDYFKKTWNLVADNPELEFERNLTMINLGEVYLLLDKVDSASYFLNKCYPFFKKLNHSSALYYIDTQFMELALKEGNISKAREIVAKEVAPSTVEFNMIHIRNRFLQHYFEETGNYKMAYYYNKENSRIDDSIRNERIKMRAAEIALKYRQDSILMKKELSIKEKDNEVLRLNQWLYILVLFFVTVISTMTIIVFYRKRKHDRKIWNLQTSVSSLKLENVRNRISPHFVFNVLNREMASYSDDVDKSNLINLVKLIRKNLELTESVAVSLNSELEFVRTYISLEQKSLGDSFFFEVKIDEGIDCESVLIPAMLIQIPVENSIKHALKMKEGFKKLWIKVSKGNDCIEIQIIDNGGGYRPDSSSRGTGTGLKVVTRTIQMLNLYNKSSITMSVTNVELPDKEMGCMIKYSIPNKYKYVLDGKLLTD